MSIIHWYILFCDVSLLWMPRTKLSFKTQLSVLISGHHRSFQGHRSKMAAVLQVMKRAPESTCRCPNVSVALFYQASAEDTASRCCAHLGSGGLNKCSSHETPRTGHRMALDFYGSQWLIIDSPSHVEGRFLSVELGFPNGTEMRSGLITTAARCHAYSVFHAFIKLSRLLQIL